MVAAKDKPKSTGRKHTGKYFVGSSTVRCSVRPMLVLTALTSALSTVHEFIDLFSQQPAREGYWYHFYRCRN